jgi:predicted NAD-dependent protein-ADP-ribosyltransferase YbiA (DUF1768 family)
MSVYDLQNFFLVGNSGFNTVADYDVELANNIVLSPYSKKEIKIGQKTFPSLIHYLLSLRLCYKASQQELSEAEPNEVREVLLKYQAKCENVFKKYATSYRIKSTATDFVRDGYENVKEFLKSKTDSALDILYDLIVNDSNMRDALLNSGDKTIVFHDPDTILGNGLDNRGANLLGKRLQQVRKYLKTNYQRECIAIRALNNIVSLTDEKVSNKENFTSFEKWGLSKIEFMSKLIAIFFEYLCEPREGFEKVSIPPILINPYVNPRTKKEGALVLTNNTQYDSYFRDLLKSKTNKNPEKIKNFDYQDAQFSAWEFPKDKIANVFQIINKVGAIVPRITPQMSMYCIKEVLHCGIFNTFDSVNFPLPDEETVKTISKMIKNNIQNKELALSTQIDNLVIRDIYQYVFIISEYIMLQAVSENTENYTTIIENSEKFVSDTKRDYYNYGFHTDEENAIAQFILYTCIAVMDSIDIEVLSEKEIRFCIDLLNLNQQNNFVSFDKLTKSPFEVYKSIIIQMFSEKGIIVNDETSQIVANLIETVDDAMDNAIVKNRVYSFANFI